MNIPNCIKEKPMNKYTVDDCVFIVLHKAYLKNEWRMFHEIQQSILNAYAKTYGENYARKRRFYGENTIAACVRNMRKLRCRESYNLPLDMNTEVVIKRKRINSRGWEYKFNMNKND